MVRPVIARKDEGCTYLVPDMSRCCSALAETGSIAVMWWLLALAILISLMILIGGITRLTDSGLSITEWQLISGIIPPLNERDWYESFRKYMQIPEYYLAKEGMTLEEFKFIYWWEWTHRFLGRFIGLVFIVPFLVFWWKGFIQAKFLPRLLLIFSLGTFQGWLGWYMVSSGLVDRVDVSQYRLAVHLGMAFVILGLIIWTWFKVRGYEGIIQERASISVVAVILLCLVFVQILLGGLVAGLDAGKGYMTWPLIDEAFIPTGLLAMQPWYLNFFENALTVQFNHRMLAYLIVALAGLHVMQSVSNRKSSGILFSLILLQAALGIWTLLSGVSFITALLHQLGAIVIFIVTLFNLTRVWSSQICIKKETSAF